MRDWIISLLFSLIAISLFSMDPIKENYVILFEYKRDFEYYLNLVRSVECRYYYLTGSVNGSLTTLFYGTEAGAAAIYSEVSKYALNDGIQVCFDNGVCYPKGVIYAKRAITIVDVNASGKKTFITFWR